MLRVRSLFETSLVRIDRVDHPPEAVHVDPDEEVSQQYSVNLLEQGAFSIRDRAYGCRVTPTELFLTAPGQVHRYVHDERDTAPDDVCVSVSFTDASRDEVSGLIGSLRHHGPVVPLNNRRAYLRGRLLEHLAAPIDAVALDLIAVELLAGAFEREIGRLYRPSQLSWYGRRVDAARRRLDRIPGTQPHCLFRLQDKDPGAGIAARARPMRNVCARLRQRSAAAIRRAGAALA